jgi:hypothetical protein
MNGSTKSAGQSFKDDISEAQRVLKEAIEQQRVGLDGLQAARFQLLKLFARIERLGEKLDEAFAGRPFLPDLAANAPANTRRFNAYLERHSQVTNLLKRALDLWILTCGMKREDDWVPLLIVQMQQNAAAKATQANAGDGIKETKVSTGTDSAAARNRVC